MPNVPPSPSNSILIDAEFQASSIYSQFDFDISEDLTLTLGVRSSDEELGGAADRRSLRLPKVLLPSGGWRDGNGQYQRQRRQRLRPRFPGKQHGLVSGNTVGMG